MIARKVSLLVAVAAVLMVAGGCSSSSKPAATSSTTTKSATGSANTGSSSKTYTVGVLTDITGGGSTSALYHPGGREGRGGFGGHRGLPHQLRGGRYRL